MAAWGTWSEDRQPALHPVAKLELSDGMIWRMDVWTEKYPYHPNFLLGQIRMHGRLDGELTISLTVEKEL